jgi:hypothetical protein
MKKNLFIIAILVAGISLLVVSCKKNVLKVPYTYTAGMAYVKVNYASPYKANPGVEIKFNDQRVSSVLSYSYPYPGGGLNTGGGSQPDFFQVNPGALKIDIVIPKVGTNTDSVVLYTTSTTVAADKYYSFHITDTSAATQSFLLDENASFPDSGFSKYRFVNLMPNLPALDLYFGSTLVASNVAYKAASPFFTIGSTNAAQWAIRPAGAAATSAAITTYPTASTLYTVPNQRVLTVFARGYSTISATTDPRRGQVSLYYVR